MASTISATLIGISKTADNSGILNLTSTSGTVLINGSSLSNPFNIEGTNQIGCVMSSTPKGDPFFGFSSSGPYTSFNNYSVGDNGNISLQAFHMATGDGYPSGTTNYFYSGTDTAFTQRKLVWANGQRMGPIIREVGYPSNQTSYTGASFMLFPVRNTTGSPITRTFSYGSSMYWSSGYEGRSVALFTPNASTYSATTGGTWTSLLSTTGTNGVNSTTTFSVTVPANTTVLLMSCASWFYYSTYQFYETNYFYNLNGYMDSSLICDQRLLFTLAFAKFTSSYSTQEAYLAYNMAATLYGNR